MMWKLILACLLMTILSEKENKQAFATSVIPKPFSKIHFSKTLSASTSPLWIADRKEFRLSEVLEMINQMEDSLEKAILLNDVVLEYIQLGKIKEARQLLAQSVEISQNLRNQTVKINLLTNIAQQYAEIGDLDKAKEILTLTEEIANAVEDDLTRGQLLLKIALSYQIIGLEDSSQTLISQSQESITQASEPIPEFPFVETPRELSLGLAANVNSFRDTTAFLGVNIDFYKQWSQEDLAINGTIAVSFDSGRDVNNYRPTGLITTVYRHHFDPKWNFFTDLFIATNQDLFATRNDDEDLTVLINGIVGAGLNLWRGDSPQQFLDAQFGLGTRYEYDFIDFEEQRNRVDPIIAFILLGRGFQIGKATVNEIFAIIPSLENFGDLTISSDTRLSIPISQRWSFTNRLFIRYRTERLIDVNPPVEFFFTTGVDYRF